MLRFVCIAIFSNKILENKYAMISLLVKGSQSGRKNKSIFPFNAHNQAWKKCEALLNQKHHVETIMSKQSNQV